MLPLTAGLVACEAYTFTEAFALIWHEAQRLGAGFLPDDVKEELEDWLASELSAAVQAQLEGRDIPEGALTPEQARKLWESLRHVT